MPVHGRHRGQVAAFVEQGRPHLGGCLVAEPFASSSTSRISTTSVRRSNARCDRGRGAGGPAAAGVRCVGSALPWSGRSAAQARTSGRCRDRRARRLRCRAMASTCSSVSTLLESSSKSACTFPWTSMIASLRGSARHTRHSSTQVGRGRKIVFTRAGAGVYRGRHVRPAGSKGGACALRRMQRRSRHPGRAASARPVVALRLNPQPAQGAMPMFQHVDRRGRARPPRGAAVWDPFAASQAPAPTAPPRE